MLDQDEYIKADSTAEQLGKLKPAFKKAEAVKNTKVEACDFTMPGWLRHSRPAPFTRSGGCRVT